jgi:hypothetical protein
VSDEHAESCSTLAQRSGTTTLMYLAEDHVDGPSAAAAKKKDEWKRSTLMGRHNCEMAART